MNFEEITTIIGTFGFPIAMCLLLFWYMIQQDIRFEKIVDGLKESLNELRVTLEGWRHEEH